MSQPSSPARFPLNAPRAGFLCQGEKPYLLKEDDYQTLLRYPETTGWKETGVFEVNDGSPFRRTCRRVENERTQETFTIVHPPLKRNQIQFKSEGESSSITGARRIGGQVDVSLRLHPQWALNHTLSGKKDLILDEEEVRTEHEGFYDHPARTAERMMLSGGLLVSYGHIPREGMLHRLLFLGGPLFFSLKPSGWFLQGNQDRKNYLYGSPFFGFRYADPVQPLDPKLPRLSNALVPVSSTRVQFSKEIGPFGLRLRGQIMQDLARDESLPHPVFNTELSALVSIGVRANLLGRALSLGVMGEINWARERPPGVPRTFYKIIPFGGTEWSF